MLSAIPDSYRLFVGASRQGARFSGLPDICESLILTRGLHRIVINFGLQKRTPLISIQLVRVRGFKDKTAEIANICAGVMRAARVDQRPVGKARIWFAWVIAGVSALVSTTAIALAADNSPQIVVPKFGGAGGYVEDMSTVDVSLWEYSNKRKYVTTGKSISFRVPNAYFGVSINRQGGPQSAIFITFDKEGGKPWLVGGAGGTAPPGRAGNALRQARRVSLTLSTYGFVNASLSPERIEAGKDIPGAAPSWPARRIEGDYCGFELFDTEEPWLIANLGDGNVFDPRVSEAPPFNRAKLLARRRIDGTYDRIINCPPSSGLEYP